MDIVFDKLFDSIENTIVPNAVWADSWSGRKMISSAVIPEVVGCTSHLVKLKPGEKAKCVVTNGRKMVFLGTILGVIMVYQHIPNSSEKLRTCAPDKLWEDIFDFYFIDKPSLGHMLTHEELLAIMEYSSPLVTVLT